MIARCEHPGTGLHHSKDSAWCSACGAWRPEGSAEWLTHEPPFERWPWTEQLFGQVADALLQRKLYTAELGYNFPAGTVDLSLQFRGDGPPSSQLCEHPVDALAPRPNECGWCADCGAWRTSGGEWILPRRDEPDAEQGTD